MRKGLTYTLSIVVCLIIFAFVGFAVALTVSDFEADNGNDTKASVAFSICLLVGLIFGIINARYRLKQHEKAIYNGLPTVTTVTPQNKLPPNTFI
jgi:uncharacterized protein YneF (UPF0154 family)